MIPFNTSFEKLKEIVISHEKIIVNANNLDEYFGIEIHEDNLYDYKNMDRIIFKKTSDYKDGQDCIVTFNHEKTIFTKILKQENGLLLQPIKSNEKPVFYTNKELKQNHIEIFGVACKLIRNLE